METVMLRKRRRYPQTQRLPAGVMYSPSVDHELPASRSVVGLVNFCLLYVGLDEGHGCIPFQSAAGWHTVQKQGGESGCGLVRKEIEVGEGLT